MKILFWIIVLPILALVGAFAAVNHDTVTLRLWPLPYEAVMPIYGAVLGAFVLGFAVAGLWVWLAALPARIARRRLARHERRLEDEIAELREQLTRTRDELQRAETRVRLGARDDRTIDADRHNMIANAD